MVRKLYYWKLPSGDLRLGEKTLIMAILNVTPDSFSDGGRFHEPERAYARALELEEQGADIIDLGAESTRPESARIPADEEWRRLVPVLKLLKGRLTIPLSLDTYKSEIAERAVEYGVGIFNDPSGLTFDPALAKVAAESNAGLILNHMRGLPESWAKLPTLQDAAASIARDLDATTSRARRAGVDKARMVIDPGIGFGKRKEQNSEILGQLGQLAALGYPILVGPSRKSFLSQPSEGETMFATAAAVAAAILRGAHIVRVHDVPQMRVVAQVTDEIARLSVEEPPQEEKRARPDRRPRFDDDQRARPTRPPLARPAAPPPPAPPPPATVRRDDRPRYGDRPGDRPPKRAGFGGKPRPFGPPRGDRDSPPRRDNDRPPRRDSGRPAKKGPWRDRPPSGERPRGDRPSGDRPFGDRPPKKPFGDRPPKRPFRKRP